MKKFTTWLDKNPGMATTLHTKLGINATNVSNVKACKKPIPWSWFSAIVDLSGGRFTKDELYNFRIRNWPNKVNKH